MTLNKQQKDLLAGTLLGDGNLQSDTKGRTWRYRVLHAEKQYPYLLHKYRIVEDLCGTEPKKESIFDERTGKSYKRWYFNTLVNDGFRYYGNMFYTYDSKNGRFVKDVPVEVEKILSPEAIAYWYMDDGNLKWAGHSNAMRFCTESYTEDGVNRLKRALKNLYDIETQLVRKTADKSFVGYRLAIDEENSQPFRRLIEPYLVDSMRYKVSDGNRGRL